MRKSLNVVLMGIILFVLSACADDSAEPSEDIHNTRHEDTTAETDIEEYDEEDLEAAADVVVEEYDGAPADTYDVVYTLDEVLALTFDGIQSKEEMTRVLDALDEHQLTATFFASVEQLEMYPEGVAETIDRGHEIGNNGLYGIALDVLNYGEIHHRIKWTNEAIEAFTGESPEFIHAPNDEDERVKKIAAQLDMRSVISPVRTLSSSEDEAKMARDAGKAIARGGVLSMDPEDEELIPYLTEAAEAVDFEFVSLDELLEMDEGRKDFEDIEGADAIQVNSDIWSVPPVLHHSQPTEEREVALTFDDWASEATVLEVLDILDAYDIKSTFYLKTLEIEKNPNLARVLVERGHEVANHTHSHPDATTITPEALQEDVYEAHRIITEAIQEPPALYFRPPFGRIDEQNAHAIAAMGYEAIGMYDLSSYDWNEEYTEADVVNRVMTNVQPGSVIVMHILDDIHTPAVLDDVIEALQADGYEFVLTSDWLDE
ncbi:polysaccharide deacetylase family protein [Salinicoccus kekensis]|uniref:Peptidoglycan/xylan/chitin deacetylase (PgdA/CDA1 family) n=1 Tax=Salinicoccus kekensis TaxID=714307 RepID=A0A285UB46_9STAP|nr:polysaccharide deacetylase family protein [Salinicoccus kekensis]SOC39145.1 peptidoglycan/xylan/chitin deacetylase (PgdA/CDA1 family) [Salinicoccus kekensis]